MLFGPKLIHFESSVGIRSLHALNRVWVRGYHQLMISGSIRIPCRGPLILISNHISSLDPVLIQAVVSRPIIWMVAREYCELPVLGSLFKLIRAIPVARNGRDTAAMRSALRVLRDGHVLGLFPEGRISTGPDLIPFQEGIGILALRSQAPVIPIYQSGTSFRQSMMRAILEPQQVHQQWGEMMNIRDILGKNADPATVVSYLQTQLNQLKHDGLGRKTRN